MSKAYFQKDALSNSGIKEILQSPSHFKLWKESPQEFTPALRIGQALHLYILEPHREDEVLTFCETKTFNSKAGEAFLKAYAETHICLTMDEKLQVCAMADALKREVEIMRILERCQREVEIYGQEVSSHGMIDTKAMIDAMNGNIIYDIKTTEKSALRFEWTARDYQYDVQAAWYVDRAFAMDGRLRRFIFIVIEKNPPYGIILYEIEENPTKSNGLCLRDGREKCLRAVERYGEAKALNRWPAYDTNIILTL